MWFRFALLLILWLLLYRFLNGLFRALTSGRNTANRESGSTPRPKPGASTEPPKSWSSADVIDVPYHDVQDDDGTKDDRRKSS